MRYTPNCKCPQQSRLESWGNRVENENGIADRRWPCPRNQHPASVRRTQPARSGLAIAAAFALLCATVPWAQTGDDPSSTPLPEHSLIMPSAQAAPAPDLSRSRQLSPSSRGTPLIISELMYHPRETGGTETLEFVELFNNDQHSAIIGGYRNAGYVA